MAYISVQDLRNEGVTDPPFADETVADRITLAQRTIENITRCFYEKREDFEVVLNGNGHNCLWLPIPPVSITAITSVTVNDTVLNADEYVVVMPQFPDGRMNPRLRKVSGSWPKGEGNITIVGDFGYVEPDGSTPPEVIDLCKRIAVWNMPAIGDAESQKANLIIEESIKNYRYRLSEVASRGFFGDPRIDNVLANLRRTSFGTL